MKRQTTAKASPPKSEYITRSELARLSFCNSQQLPLAVNDGGIRKEWIGIGWIEVGKPRGDEAILI